VSRLSPVDLVLVEGFKRDPHPKLEIYRGALGKPLLHPQDPHIVAIATDAALNAPLPVLPLGDAGAIADFIVAHMGLA
jgi:molybdopterin-guanine dinucleotide biosynthesis protein B